MSDSDALLGRLLVEQGLARQDQIDECLRLREQLAAEGVTPTPRLGDLMVRRGYLAAADVERTLRRAERAGSPAPSPPEVEEAAREPANLIGRYVRVSKLGAGGMGEVWKAWDIELCRWVALKFLKGEDSDELTRFTREAQMAATLNHPNIAAVYEVGESAGRPFIAMQYIDGPTLAAFPRTDRRRLVSLMRDATLAVQHANERTIIHRDIKPANLMVEDNRAGGRVYVMDFGLAKQRTAGSSVSVSGMMVGTPAYMPPEQAQGRLAQIDARSDVYGLGATLYELLSGRPPFHDENVYEVLLKVVTEDPQPLRRIHARIDEDLETVVMKCLEKDPARRYATAQELAEELSRWLEGEPILAHPPSLFYRMRKYAARRRGAVAMGAIGVLAMVAGAIAVAAVARQRGLDRRVSDLLVRAERMYEAGRTDETQRLAAEALALRPGDPQARFWLGRLRIRDYMKLRGVPEARVVRGLVTLVPPRPETTEEKRLRESIEQDLAAITARPIAEGVLALWAGSFSRAVERFERVTPEEAGAWEAEVYAGVAHYLNGDFEKAKTALERHVGRDPAMTRPVWIRTLVALAQSMERRGQSTEALYMRAIGECADVGGPAAKVLEAQAYVAWGRMESAVGRNPDKRYERAIELAKLLEDAEGHAIRGDALLSLAAHRADTGRLNPDDPQEFEDAIEAYADAIARDATSAVAYLKRGEAHHARNEYLRTMRGASRVDPEQAASDFRRALELDPRHVDAALGLVWAESVLQAMDEGGEILDQRLKYEALERRYSDKPAVLRAHARASTEHGEYIQNLGRDPGSIYESALRDLVRAIELDASFALAHVDRARVYVSQAKYCAMQGKSPESFFKACIAAVDEALKINPSFTPAFTLRGDTHLNLAEYCWRSGGDPMEWFDAAQTDYRRAAEINPLLIDARLGLAHIHVQQGQVRGSRGEDALPHLKTAIEKFDLLRQSHPANAGVWKGLGDAHRHAGYYLHARGGNPMSHYETAIDAYMRSIKLHLSVEPLLGAAITMQNAGFVREETGQDPRERYTLALSYLDQGLKLVPHPDLMIHRGKVRQNLAMSRWRLGEDPTSDLQEALADFDRAARSSFANPDLFTYRGMTRHNLGRIRYRRGEDPGGDYEAAIADLDRAVEMRPSDGTPYAYRALVRQNLGVWRLKEGRSPRAEYEGAVADYQRALKIDATNAETWTRLGSVQRWLTRRDEALQSLSQALKLNPNSAEALRYRAETLLDLGRKAEAAADLKRALQIDPSLKNELDPLLKRARE